jgi:membrane protease YdiL (CAAX protease family)
VSPPVIAILLLVFVLGILSLVGSMALWSLVIYLRVSRGIWLLPATSRERPRHSILHLALPVVVMVVASFAIGRIAVSQGWWVPPTKADMEALNFKSADWIWVMGIDGGAKWLGLLFVVAILSITPSFRFAHVGLKAMPWKTLAGVTVASLLLFIPPTYVFQAVLVQLIPYEHPLQDALFTNGTPMVILVCALTAVVTAPIVEEFFFRGLLQGYLQQFADRFGLYVRWSPTRSNDTAITPSSSAMSMSGRAGMSGDGFTTGAAGQTGSILVASRDSTVREGAPADASPYQQFGRSGEEQPGEVAATTVPQAWWPMFVASGIFAGLHLGQGPAPVSLFFLSLGWGYVFRQTGSLWPSLIGHFCLNAFSTSMMLLQVYGGIPRPQ